MADGWAALARVTATAVLPRQTVPYHVGYAPDPPASLAPFTLPDLPDSYGAVTVDTALTVPAYARGIALIAGTVATFPLEEWRDGRRIPRRTLLDRPDPDTTRQVTLTRTVEDLAHYGCAWWQVLARDDTGKPRHARHVDAATVAVDTVGRVTLDGRLQPAGSLLRFDHDRYGALVKGARILRTALSLEGAARRYADSPAPRTVLSGTGDVHLPDDDARALLDAYVASIRQRGVAYMDAVTATQVGWDAAQLQLVEARMYTAAQVATLLGLDPWWVGASQPGASLTYQNRQDLYRGLVDLTLRPYLATIEQRLSADDITEHGRSVRFDLDAFLRGNPTERVALVTQLLGAEVIDRDEARALLDLAPAEETTRTGGLL